MGAGLRGGQRGVLQKTRENRENRTLTDVNRRDFGVDGRFSAVNRRSCRRFAAKKGPGNFTPKKSVI